MISQSFQAVPFVSGFWPRFDGQVGDRIAYHVPRGDGGYSIMVKDILGSAPADTIYSHADVRIGFDWAHTQKIVYVRDPGRELWVMDEDGTNHRPVVQNPGDVNYPALSPNGAWVAYTRLVGGAFEVFVHRMP